MRPQTMLLAIGVCLIAVIPLAGIAIAAGLLTLPSLGQLAALSAIGLGMGFAVRDAGLSQTKALPNGANTIYSTGFDLGHGAKGDFLAQCEYQIVIPTLTTTELGDTQTITISLQHDTASDFSGAVAIPGYEQCKVFTGSGGAGATGATISVRLPVDVNRYVRAKAVKAGATNASTASLTERLVF